MPVESMGIHSGIGAKSHFDSAGEGMSEVLAGCGHHVLTFRNQFGGHMQTLRVRPKPLTKVQSAPRVSAVILHRGDSSLVDVRGVLDGISARLRGPEDALRSMRM